MANDYKRRIREIIDTGKKTGSAGEWQFGQVMTKIETFIQDDDRLKEMMKTGKEQEDIVKKLEKLLILNDSNIDLLEKKLAREAEAEAERARHAEQGEDVNAQTTRVVQNAFSVGPAFTDEEEDEIPEVNPLLNEDIDFRKRLELVMKAKANMEKQGEHFHKMFDDVLVAVMENVNPYLIGPSGCGKTYMVSQISRLLNASFIDIGYINEEYDILGFQTANGGYSRPNFYRCYKYGKIAFCDELDNGNSRATVKLNSFLSNTKDAGYNFPHGEHVRRHPNFRIIAAGNTSGNGADSVYNTREKIEESVQQRFTPIYVGYDNEVERAILGDRADWFEFIVLFRSATNEWARKSHSAAPGIITTRDAARIKKYLDNDSFPMHKILDYEFIQTKDESYLAFLADYIRNNYNENGPAALIAQAFMGKVDAIRRGDIER